MTKTTKIVFWIIIAIIAIGGIWWGVKNQHSIQRESIRVGSILPLTGDISNYGIDAKNAIDLAVKEINEIGGIDGQKLEIIYEDDQCDPKQTVTTINKLININKVKTILGPFCSGASLAAAPIAQNNKIFLLSGAATSPNLTEYNLFFRTISSDSYTGKFVAEYAYNKLGKRKAAIAYAENDYCVGLKDVFKKRFEELGGKTVVEMGHSEGAMDIRTQIARIKNTEADFVFLSAYPIDGGYFLKQAKELKNNLPVLATESIEDQQVTDIAGEGAEGVILSGPKKEKDEEFIRDYKFVFDKNPGVYGIFFYDATKILANALEKCGEQVDCIRNYFVNLKDYQGASGKKNFDDNGDQIGGEFVLKTVKNGQFVPYED